MVTALVLAKGSVPAHEIDSAGVYVSGHGKELNSGDRPSQGWMPFAGRVFLVTQPLTAVAPCTLAGRHRTPERSKIQRKLT